MTDMTVIGKAIEKLIIRFLMKVGKAKLILMLFKRRQVAITWCNGKPSQKRNGTRANAAPTPATVKTVVKPNTMSIDAINVSIDKSP
jgi:hypothetical protein